MSDKKSRILIVDDEPNNLQLMRQILKDYYQLAFASSGTKVLEISSQLETDMILLDIMMPGMDGYEVCRALKADQKTKHIPVIFITAKDAVDDEAKGLELGAIDYITKPISPSIVKARLKNHLELKLARERIEKQKQRLEDQNRELVQAASLREDVERMMRHDMKNPLNAIIGLSKIMKNDGNLTEGQREYLSLIEESGYDLLKMINMSLDMLKMEKGAYQFDPEQVDIIEIITKILNEMNMYMAKKGLSSELLVGGVPSGDESHLFVQGEKLLCYSMLTNLIKNAVEASPKDSRIIIRCDNNDKKAVICIHNQGTVPENIRDCFFDKYVTYGKKGGTGLGTYSAKLIAETQGGSIRMDTSGEEGSINGTLVTIEMKCW